MPTSNPLDHALRVLVSDASGSLELAKRHAEPHDRYAHALLDLVLAHEHTMRALECLSPVSIDEGRR